MIRTLNITLFWYLYHATFTILYYDQQMHKYFTNYHTPPTCFDTIVSSSESSQLVPYQVTQVCQMQLLVIQLKLRLTLRFQHHKTYVKHLNCKLYYRQLHLKYLCNLARYWLQAAWGWHDSVETCRSSVIICEIIVHLLVIVQNNSILHLIFSRNVFGLKNYTFIFLLRYRKIWCTYIV